MARVIFHIDINAFFASAHLITDDAYLNKPLVVCRNTRSAVVTTASYEARSYGINSAMPLSHAKNLCSDLEVVEPDFELYSNLSERFINIIRGFSPKVQQASIDECYVDVTEEIRKYKKPLDMAVAIQRQVEKELKLPISIGVAPNKFLAKTASDMLKPRGITVLRIRDVQEKLWPMPIDQMHGIGKKTVVKLLDQGIHTIQDLAEREPESLRSVLGMSAESFVDKANGIDLSPMDYDTSRKSLGQSKTFPKTLYDLDEIRHAIRKEIDEVERRLKSHRIVGRTIQFSIRLEDFKSAVRSITLDHYVDSADAIFERVMVLYDEFDGQGGVDFVSVTLSNLIERDEMIEQINIFEGMEEPSVVQILERLNQSMDGAVFMTPRQLLNKKEKK